MGKRVSPVERNLHMEASAMPSNKSMLSPAVLLEAMQSKERVRRRLLALIRDQEERTRDTVELLEAAHWESLPSRDGSTVSGRLLACN